MQDSEGTQRPLSSGGETRTVSAITPTSGVIPGTLLRSRSPAQASVWASSSTSLLKAPPHLEQEERP